MGKVFWIACGIVLAGAIGLYAWTRSVPRAEVEKLGQQVDTRRKTLHVLAGKKLKEIKNPHFISEVTEYKEKLAGQEKSLKDIMRARDIDLSDKAFGDPPPPRTSVAGFRLWLMDKYSKRDALLREKKIIFPKDGSKVDDVVDWETIGTEEIPRVLRQYVISKEVFGALADAEAKVTYKYVDDETKKPVENVVTEKVVELEELVLGATRRGTGHQATAAPAAEDRFAERSFTVRFVAHFNVALDVMRGLEGSKRALFVVREISIKRHEKAFRVDVMEEMRKSVEPYLNTMKKEAPVKIALQVGLLDYPDVSPGSKGAGGGP